jgi:hypothetical protein
MTWESKEQGTARRSTQERFRIYHEQLEFGCPEFIEALNAQDEDETLGFKQGFAKELLACIGDHLSIADIEQIVEVFSDELITRNIERNRDISKIVERMLNKNE